MQTTEPNARHVSRHLLSVSNCYNLTKPTLLGITLRPRVWPSGPSALLTAALILGLCQVNCKAMKFLSSPAVKMLPHLQYLVLDPSYAGQLLLALWGSKIHLFPGTLFLTRIPIRIVSLYYIFNVSNKNVFISAAADLVLKEIANEVKAVFQALCNYVAGFIHPCVKGQSNSYLKKSIF